ncbi:MAG TPA: hypothetical protein VF988_04210 [Verrucomicrobiae bacterium]
MKQQSKLSQKQEQGVEQQTHTQAGTEFTSSEELLRFDAAQTSVPPEIAERLKKSAADIAPPPKQSWWRKMLGR